MKRLLILLSILVLASQLMATEIPTSSYVYDSDGRAVRMPASYYASAVHMPISGQSYVDLFVEDGGLYILCSDGGILAAPGGDMSAIRPLGGVRPHIHSRNHVASS